MYSKPWGNDGLAASGRNILRSTDEFARRAMRTSTAESAFNVQAPKFTLGTTHKTPP